MKRRMMEWMTQPMCIGESAFRAVVAKLACLPDPAAAVVEHESLELADIYGPPSVRQEDHGVVRVIHIAGVIDRFVPALWRQVGYADVEEISALVRSAHADDAVQAIVLEMNTPGGSVWGTPEAAAVIQIVSQDKPVVVHASNLLASGGYYLAAGASAILADPSAEIGSIGVYCPMFDFSGMYDAFGIKVELAKTGELKGAGFEGTSWTPEQKAHEQEVVNDMFQAFKAHVQENRRVSDAQMTGGCYVAPRAMAYGLIDEIGSLEEAVALAETLAAGPVKQSG